MGTDHKKSEDENLSIHEKIGLSVFFGTIGLVVLAFVSLFGIGIGSKIGENFPNIVQWPFMVFGVIISWVAVYLIINILTGLVKLGVDPKDMFK